MRLSNQFFNRDCSIVARDLLGKTLIKQDKNKLLKGIVVETEAYFTDGDKASHSFLRNKAREFFNQKKPGTAYVYLNYGMYWLLNVITKNGAVLFRALEPLSAIETMKQNRKTDDLMNLLSGPGKLTQAFQIDGNYHGSDLTKNHLFLSSGINDFKIVKTKRIGISKDEHKLLRFYIEGNKFISSR